MTQKVSDRIKIWPKKSLRRLLVDNRCCLCGVSCPNGQRPLLRLSGHLTLTYEICYNRGEGEFYEKNYPSTSKEFEEAESL